ncbi:hypothetical protein P5G61_20955 [Paenibacillus sp. F6_3S_P_1C]|uniref:Uncharacterized protein n=1 Tax=Paenibacillus vandeheii TaxID=3035917 RepID=A0ABT8JF53_9BACL|nr:hypothetical protein [Paenibacillus vandeheii]MDN4603726.1 hypothetical protein [Paenibacillus vandeheii]
MDGRSPGSRFLDHSASSEWYESTEFAAHIGYIPLDKLLKGSLGFHRSGKLLLVGRAGYADDG